MRVGGKLPRQQAYPGKFRWLLCLSYDSKSHQRNCDEDQPNDVFHNLSSKVSILVFDDTDAFMPRKMFFINSPRRSEAGNRKNSLQAA